MLPYFFIVLKFLFHIYMRELSGNHFLLMTSPGIPGHCGTLKHFPLCFVMYFPCYLFTGDGCMLVQCLLCESLGILLPCRSPESEGLLSGFVGVLDSGFQGCALSNHSSALVHTAQSARVWPYLYVPLKMLVSTVILFLCCSSTA